MYTNYIRFIGKEDGYEPITPYDDGCFCPGLGILGLVPAGIPGLGRGKQPASFPKAGEKDVAKDR